MSVSAQAALQHLKKKKPSDGWSIETKSSGSTTTVRLLRRSVPLTDNFFLDIHYDKVSDSVVGILTPKRDGLAQSQVLVDANGKPQGRHLALLRVADWDPSTASTSRTTAASAPSTNRAAPASASDTGTLTLEQNKKLLQYAASGVGALFCFRLLFSAMFGIYILAFPLVYLYLVQKCPNMESFDAKKEIKRVLRGYHLPDDDPNKPKGFLSETIARIGATITTELATGTGYEIQIYPLAGAAHVAAVRVPSAKMDCYWVGAVGRWFYVYSREMPDDA